MGTSKNRRYCSDALKAARDQYREQFFEVPIYCWGSAPLYCLLLGRRAPGCGSSPTLVGILTHYWLDGSAHPCGLCNQKIYKFYEALSTGGAGRSLKNLGRNDHRRTAREYLCKGYLDRSGHQSRIRDS
jgi:hypothetical protein